MPRLVFLPGLAADAAMWREQIQAFAPLAPRVSDVHTRNPSIEAMASALLAENDGELVLCGASMGGMVAMEAVRQAPERVRGLALLGTNAAPETAQMRKLREDAIVAFEAGRVRDIIEPNIAFAFHPANADRLAPSYLEFVLRAGAAQLIAQNRAVIARPDARRHLGAVRCPVLVMCGEDDRLTPSAQSREIAALVPHAQFELVPQCGHMLTMEQPEAVNERLAAWLAPLFAAE